MGILDKLHFGKKKDDFSDFDSDFGKDPMGTDSLGGDFSPQSTSQDPSHDAGFGDGMSDPSFGSADTPSFAQHSQPSAASHPLSQSQGFSSQENSEYINSKNLEVISSKIDALRATLDSINQRLAHLEQIAQGEQQHNRRGGGFY